MDEKLLEQIMKWANEESPSMSALIEKAYNTGWSDGVTYADAYDELGEDEQRRIADANHAAHQRAMDTA